MEGPVETINRRWIGVEGWRGIRLFRGDNHANPSGQQHSDGRSRDPEERLSDSKFRERQIRPRFRSSQARFRFSSGLLEAYSAEDDTAENRLREWWPLQPLATPPKGLSKGHQRSSTRFIEPSRSRQNDNIAFLLMPFCIPLFQAVSRLNHRRCWVCVVA
jgi:hypothetical protein